MGSQKKTRETVWMSRKKGSNVLRIMNQKQAKKHLNETGETIFTKFKKWELDQL